MAVYELSIDSARLREAERIVSLEGRGYPTLVMRWESRIFDQTWATTIVLDYLLALPPLMVGTRTFHDVRIAAFVDRANTKFLYFGTEMTADVPRIGPEMENEIGEPKVWQEFRLEEHSCPVPYLKLIQTTPRIYGNGPQDYYSPPLKVERYDGVASADLLADFFPTVTANLDAVRGPVLTDPGAGMWNGARFVGVTAIAIVRAGKVVGMHRRLGRADRDTPPREVVRRDPELDVKPDTVAIDLGSRSTVVAIRAEGQRATLLRIGAENAPAKTSAHFESPTEIAFKTLAPTLKAWRDRVIQPITRWDDVNVGVAAQAFRTKPGDDKTARAMSTLTELTLLRERIDAQKTVRMVGFTDPDSQESLRKPAPPIIDDEGIGAHDPFDPVELYAYYIGLHVNQRHRGIYRRYAITLPTGLSPERRQQLVVAMRRGLFRSLPAGFCEFHDLEKLEVVDAGPTAIPFAVSALRAFGVQSRGEPVPFCVIEAGASETGLVFGVLRDPRPSEQAQGLERVLEYLEPESIPWLGGERLLARLAYRVYKANEALLTEAHVPFEKPDLETGDVSGTLFAPSAEARANVASVKDGLRKLLTDGPSAAVETKHVLATLDGKRLPMDLAIDAAALHSTLVSWVHDGVLHACEALAKSIGKMSRGVDPYDGLHVVIGGRFGAHPAWADGLAQTLPKSAKVHKFLEPDPSNLGAPTVKTATALGVLALRFDRVGAVLRAESRDVFRYRVGRGRHGQLADVLDPSVEYDFWREAGAATKPFFEVLYMPSADDGEVAADDPRVQRAGIVLPQSAIGQRIYLRAVSPTAVEFATGPAGGEPDPNEARYRVDLVTNVVERVAAR